MEKHESPFNREEFGNSIPVDRKVAVEECIQSLRNLGVVDSVKVLPREEGDDPCMVRFECSLHFVKVRPRVEFSIETTGKAVET